MSKRSSRNLPFPNSSVTRVRKPSFLATTRCMNKSMVLTWVVCLVQCWQTLSWKNLNKKLSPIADTWMAHSFSSNATQSPLFWITFTSLSRNIRFTFDLFENSTPQFLDINIASHGIYRKETVLVDSILTLKVLYLGDTNFLGSEQWLTAYTESALLLAKLKPTSSL